MFCDIQFFQMKYSQPGNIVVYKRLSKSRFQSLRFIASDETE